MPDPLVMTKLYIPRVRAKWVDRPRLLERLQNGLQSDHKLLLISAPAGFGKTALLSAWIHANAPPMQVAWLSLDEDDNDSGHFFTYLVAALAQIDRDAGQRLSAVLQMAATPQPKPLLSALIQELDGRERPFILVFDDYHAIQNQDVHDALNFLVEHLPAHAHVVVSGRVEPPLPLSRLRVRDQMTEIRRADLRFTLPETTALLNECFVLDLDAEDIAALEARTEGWGASLQLAALSLQGREDKHGFVAAFSGSHRYVIDYLMDEVIAGQPDATRAFLYQTSILTRFCAPLCDAVTETAQSQATLEYLDRANLFLVPLDDRRAWYRYHHLFADMLRARLKIESPQTIPQLHRRAAEWYAGQGLIADAIHHALAAGAYDLAAQWVAEAVTETFRRGHVNTVRRWLAALPEDLVHTTPMLALSYAWVSVIAMDVYKIDDYMDRLEDLLHTAPADSSELRAVWLSNAMAIRSTRALHLNQVEDVITYAEKGLAYLSGNPEGHHRLRSVLGYNLAFAYGIRGQVEQARRAYEQAIDAARQIEHVIIIAFAGYHLGELYRACGRLHDAIAVHRQTMDLVETLAPSSPLVGMTQVGLGIVECERFDLAAAQADLESGIEQCQRAGIAEIATEGYRWLTTVYQARRETTPAQTALETTLKMYRSLNHVEATARAALCQAQYRLARGNLAQVEPLITADEPSQNTSDETTQADMLILALAHLALGHVEEATQVVAQLEDALVQGRVVDPVSVAVLRTLAHVHQGHRERAVVALERGLDLAAPEGHVRPFVNAGQPIYDLLSIYAASGAARADFVDRLLEAFRDVLSPAAPTVSPLVEPLSEREMDVLRLMDAGLKYKEIADRLFISVNTVNYHVKNLYGKLGVHNRAQAMARARELELLA